MREALSWVLRGLPPIVRRGQDNLDAELVIGNDVPHPLAGPARISLQVRMRLHTAHEPEQREPRRMVIVAYQYTLLDADQREILAFHWHPAGPSHVSTPHLHLGAGSGQLRADLAAAHLPTGPLTLAVVVRLAVEAFAVRPLRPDWDAVLTRSGQVLLPK